MGLLGLDAVSGCFLQRRVERGEWRVESGAAAGGRAGLGDGGVGTPDDEQGEYYDGEECKEVLAGGICCWHGCWVESFLVWRVERG